MDDGQRIEGVLASLLLASSHLPPDRLPAVVADEARRAGFGQALIFLIDQEQRMLRPLTPPEPAVPVEVEGTIAGRVFQTERPLAVQGAGSASIWLPLIDGAERLGVLLLERADASDELVAQCEPLASLVAELLVSKSQYGDAIAVARRSHAMTLEAEIRWSMLPPLTFTGDGVGIACVLEPAYEVAGDAFDYAFNDGVLHVAIFDAMGHGFEAGAMATLAQAAYRSGRRRRLDLVATYREIDLALQREFGDEHFVTAQLATLDSRTGTLRWVNAGHPHPLLLRRGRTASELVSTPALPLGLGDAPMAPAEVSLEPDDRLLLFTDGVVEARSPGGERFGQERLVDLARRALADQQTLAETVRRLSASVQFHRDGPLDDDATILFLEWCPA